MSVYVSMCIREGKQLKHQKKEDVCLESSFKLNINQRLDGSGNEESSQGFCMQNDNRSKNFL